MDEMQAVAASCHHVHDKEEWQRKDTDEGRVTFVTKREAEYTAELAFAIAVAMSWWAVRVGWATSS